LDAFDRVPRRRPLKPGGIGRQREESSHEELAVPVFGGKPDLEVDGGAEVAEHAAIFRQGGLGRHGRSGQEVDLVDLLTQKNRAGNKIG
jgi:hypothetical protein